MTLQHHSSAAPPPLLGAKSESVRMQRRGSHTLEREPSTARGFFVSIEKAWLGELEDALSPWDRAVGTDSRAGLQVRDLVCLLARFKPRPTSSDTVDAASWS